VGSDRGTGPIAAALMENAGRLLASAPEILPADVLAANVPWPRSSGARAATFRRR
jgi:hypothetical protein